MLGAFEAGGDGQFQDPFDPMQTNSKLFSD